MVVLGADAASAIVVGTDAVYIDAASVSDVAVTADTVECRFTVDTVGAEVFGAFAKSALVGSPVAAWNVAVCLRVLCMRNEDAVYVVNLVDECCCS